MTPIKNEKIRTVLRFVIPLLMIPAAAILGELCDVS